MTAQPPGESNTDVREASPPPGPVQARGKGAGEDEEPDPGLLQTADLVLVFAGRGGGVLIFHPSRWHCRNRRRLARSPEVIVPKRDRESVLRGWGSSH